MLWHYTVGAYIPSIIKDGCIKPANALVQPPEKPITWFTTSPLWEETANKGWRDLETGIDRTLSSEETAKLCGGLFRIGVGDDYPLKRFMRITLLSKQERWLTKALIQTAEAFGSNPYRDWWGTFNNVAIADWKTIENLTSNGWESLSQTIAA